ncbi:MAG: 23S rRNA (uracil(1939)-C(5))-methyltransferase RlmD [Deltaproteobacteria bacterium]|nr:23S rRNA (uracil(1939)-C(5))-methyltransferase RlmD [Deltaproteobacteria bacterium]
MCLIDLGGRAPRPGDQIELEFERLSEAGGCLGTIVVPIGPQQEPRRYRVEVPRGLLPGERARVSLTKRYRRTFQARALSLLRPSPHRQDPRCIHARGLGRALCGGCAMQTLDYSQQLALKQQRVERQLAAANVDPRLILPIVACDSPYFYRNKMEFSFAGEPAAKVALGLHPPGYRYDVVDLSGCQLLSPFTGPLLEAVRGWANATELPVFSPRQQCGWLLQLTVREGKNTNERLLELLTSTEDPVSTAQRHRPAQALAEGLVTAVLAAADQSAQPIDSIYWTRKRAQRGQPTTLEQTLLFGKAAIDERLDLPDGRSLTFSIDPRAFFQPNPRQAQQLYGLVIAGFAERPVARLLDLYCGTGTIGLSLANACQEVVGVELSQPAVDQARASALRNQIANARFFVGDAAKVLEEDLRDQRFDGLVVDPPRNGLSTAALERVLTVDAARLIYVSCNPAALARDIHGLDQRYKLRSAQPVDMFPHTAHVETVAILDRR